MHRAFQRGFAALIWTIESLVGPLVLDCGGNDYESLCQDVGNFVYHVLKQTKIASKTKGNHVKFELKGNYSIAEC